jgi:nitric oxide reductase NorD protein
VKLLILLSDGRPLDDDYAADYALEDTRSALREARAVGIHPFCVTVDDRADAYIERLYGDVHYTIINDVRSLPERLPKIYKRLTT